MPLRARISSSRPPVCATCWRRTTARDLQAEPWQFALEIRSLERAGLTGTHLRWLLCQGYVAQQVEQSRPRDRQRRFRPVANLTLPESACFVLTEPGAVFARACLAEKAWPVGDDSKLVPSYDDARRELRVGVTVVKRFEQPAPDQEGVLRAFEEEQWPPRIYDPLSPRPGQDTKRRLHTTICNLNRGQAPRLIHFDGGGDGQSVLCACSRRCRGAMAER